MVTENSTSVYRQIVHQLVTILSSFGLGHSGALSATLGVFIALSKRRNIGGDLNIYSDADLQNLCFEVDENTRITLYDVCGIHLDSGVIRRIFDIINTVEASAFAALYEEVISLQFTSSLGGQYYQPKELTHLVNQLINKEGAKTVYNPFAGTASYQIDNKACCYTSQEIDKNTWIVGKIRLYLNEIHSEYYREDSLANWRGNNHIYDAVVATPPFGVRLTNEQRSELRNSLGRDYSDINTAFIDQAIHSVSNKGVVISVVPAGFLFRSGDTGALRRSLVENKYLKAVIALPQGTFRPYAGVSTAIVVITKQENLAVKFVDATSMYSQTKRANKLDVDKILCTIDSKGSEYVREVSYSEIQSNAYNIDPNRYFVEEEIIPEGYKKIRLSDVSSIIPNRRLECQMGRIVNIGDLSNNSLDCIKAVEDIAEDEIRSNQFKMIDEPVLLLSMVRALKPTYICASSTMPIYVSPNILALRVDASVIDIPYLAFELARKSDSLQRGAVIPRFNRRDILELGIYIPDLATPEDILSKEKQEIAKAQYANKEAMVRELGLTAVIDAQRQELFTLISHRKHRINPYFSGMQDNIKMLRDEINEAGSISLDHKISSNYTVKELLDNFEEQIADVKALFKNLTSEFVVEEKTTFNFMEFMNSYRYVAKNPDLKLNISPINDKTILSDREIYSSKGSLTELIDIVIENAERHAFTDRNQGNIEIGYGEDGKGIYIQILNDGTPLDENFNEELSFSEGYTHGDTGNTGKGLFRAKQICLNMGASIDWVNDDSNLFATGILISIKNV